MKTNKKPTILIVEDDDIIRENLKDFFAEEGFTVIDAMNGMLAVLKCQQNKEIDIVLMDEDMPVMTGCEAMISIKSFRPKLQIISISSKSSEKLEELRKCEKFWFDGHIQKPFTDLMELLNYVNTKMREMKEV